MRPQPGSFLQVKEFRHTATFIASPTGFSLGPNSGQSSKQTYVYKDSLGICYSRELQAANNVLNTVTDGQGCPYR